VSRRLLIALLLLIACGRENKKDPSVYDISREPVSVRGWILDVKGAQPAESPDLEIARRTELFQATSLWVEDAQFASGGIAENGAFLILDVPPNKAVVGFNAPGAETAKLTLEGVPGTADVIIPFVILEPGGSKVFDPARIRIRLPANVAKATPTGKTATIAGYKVPIISTPIAEMIDRRDYPNPGGFRPVAIVK
jgi:hypothetical protein